LAGARTIGKPALGPSMIFSLSPAIFSPSGVRRVKWIPVTIAGGAIRPGSGSSQKPNAATMAPGKIAKGGRKGAHEAPRAPQIAPGRAIFGNRLALAPKTRCPGRLFLDIGCSSLSAPFLFAGILLRAVIALVSRNVILKAVMTPAATLATADDCLDRREKIAFVQKLDKIDRTAAAPATPAAVKYLLSVHRKAVFAPASRTRPGERWRSADELDVARAENLVDADRFCSCIHEGDGT
jgi:hypothetical protein